MDFVVEKEPNDVQKLYKEKIADQLDKRNRERQELVNAKHELQQQNNASNESLDYFQETFRAQVTTIEDALANLKPSNDRIKLTQDINNIHEDIQSLQNYLTASTFFLSNYTIKACQSILNDLKARIEVTKDKLLAKKKFNFRSKVDAASTSRSTTTVDAAPSKQQPTASTVNDAFQWTLQNRQNAEIVLVPDDTNNKDITVSTLDSCLLKIFGHPALLQLSHLTNCVILCGPVSRSIFVDNCTNCKFVFSCQQIRLHTSHHCDLYVHVTGRTIIEDCNNINVAPYNYSYTNIDDDFVKAGLDTTKNNWENVGDFNWLSKDIQSPNWQHIAPEQRISCWTDYLTDFRQKILST
ncbi:tubulin-specific chaperone C [Contarinia nasturtii]|uniref:tubulin-specific chaperone C n=1 Tax=Contarinia nasturtii TaxID=265458 RepID=UPI0012D396E0|nr:tubulin-specific chaperone C [Contarinia nasturtii]